MKKKKVKKKTMRNYAKTPSLKKQYNSKVRQEYLDLDYVDQLDDTVKNCKLPDGTMVTELQYMASFMKEWNSGGVGKQSEPLKNKFHRTKEKIKECTDRTNQRNRDQYGLARSQNRMLLVDETDMAYYLDTKIGIQNDTETIIIEFLDRIRRKIRKK